MNQSVMPGVMGSIPRSDKDFNVCFFALLPIYVVGAKKEFLMKHGHSFCNAISLRIHYLTDNK